MAAYDECEEGRAILDSTVGRVVAYTAAGDDALGFAVSLISGVPPIASRAILAANGSK